MGARLGSHGEIYALQNTRQLQFTIAIHNFNSCQPLVFAEHGTCAWNGANWIIGRIRQQYPVYYFIMGMERWRNRFGVLIIEEQWMHVFGVINSRDAYFDV